MGCCWDRNPARQPGKRQLSPQRCGLLVKGKEGYPVQYGLDHDNEDDENHHVPVDVVVGVSFSLLVGQHVEGVLQLHHPVVGRPLEVFERPEKFVDLTAMKKLQHDHSGFGTLR